LCWKYRKCDVKRFFTPSHIFLCILYPNRYFGSINTKGPTAEVGTEALADPTMIFCYFGLILTKININEYQEHFLGVKAVGV